MKQFGKAALEDREKRMEFGLEWCKLDLFIVATMMV